MENGCVLDFWRAEIFLDQTEPQGLCLGSETRDKHKRWEFDSSSFKENDSIINSILICNLSYTLFSLRAPERAGKLSLGTY